MPKKKSKSTRVVKKVGGQPRDLLVSVPVPTGRGRTLLLGLSLKAKLVALIVLALLVAFGLWKKDWFVAAVVNGRPIMRWQLDKALVKQYGAQTLDGMINQDIAEQEVARQGISVTGKEVDDRINEISSTMPKGMTLDQALQIQGLDKAEFRNQVRLQLAIDKILASKTVVTDKEIDDYMASNAAQFKNVSSAEARVTARKAIEQQKGSEAFSAWFASLKQKAQVYKFI